MGKNKLTLWAAALALALPLFLAGTASAVYIGDGSAQNGTTGLWDITDYGKCFSGIKSDGTIVIDTAHNASRPDCIDHVLSAETNTAGIPTNTDYDTSAKCTATSGRSNSDDVSHYWVSNTCVDPTTGAGINLDGLDRTATNCSLKGGVRVNACTGAWTYTGPANDGAPGFCYTTVNLTTLYTTQAACPTTTTGYSWTSSQCRYSYGIAGYTTAAVNYKNGSGSTPAGTFVDLSTATQGQCAALGFSWSTGTTKSGTTSASTTPNASTIATVETTRAGCLECHNTVSQNNTYAERWKEPYLMTGHKNMLRKVTAGKNWAGPDSVIYTEAAAVGGNPQMLNFANGTVTIGANTYPLMYLFGDWMAAAPSGLDTVVWNVTAKYNNGSAYSCAACHSTGWSNPTAGTCVVGSEALPTSTTQAACGTAGGTWIAMNGVQGASYAPAEPGKSWIGNTQGITVNADNSISGITGRWDKDGILCSRCHQTVFSKTSPAPAGTGTHNVTPATTANQQVNQICFGCHQSIGKVANNTGANTDLGNPALNIPATATGFTSHPITNQFLNSPHAEYTVASGNGIVPNSLGKYDLVGNSTTQYASTFKGFLCRSSATAGGGSILATVYKGGAVHEIKTQDDCNLANGQPLGTAGYWQSENQGACTTCHDVHKSLFDPNASEPLKKECETCHIDETGTGGTGYAGAGVPQIDLGRMNHPTGFGTPFDKTLFVNACEACHMPKAAGAGFPIHLWRISTDVNYSTFPDGVTKKNANVDADGKIWVDLDIACGQCHGGSAGAGATANGAFYRPKLQLANWAKGIHDLGGNPGTPAGPSVAKGAVSINLYTVSFTDASTNATTVKVNWGDGNVEDKAAGSAFTHTYSRARNYTILHVASGAGAQFSSEQFSVTVPMKFTVDGSVAAGTTLSLRKNGRTVKALKASDTSGGSYEFTDVLPGDYTIVAYKRGVAFSNPVASFTVNSSMTVNIPTP